MSIPSRKIPTEPVRTQEGTTILAKHCEHRINIPVPTRERLEEIIDWIDMGEGGCRGIYYSVPQNWLAKRLMLPMNRKPKDDVNFDFVFQCSHTAMAVKLRWG